MFKVGITGGIGSGKTIVCRIFSSLDVPVYNADDAAKNIMQHDENIKQELKTLLGNVYDEEGQLNRKKVADIIFKNPTLLAAINNIVHPAVVAHAIEWEQQLNTPYFIRESAILFESGTNKNLDKIILVDAPEAIRIERVLQRDNRSREEIQSIINQQWSTDKKKELADYIIVNDNQQALLPQIVHLHQLFLALANT